MEIIIKELQEIRRLLSLQKAVLTLEEFCTYAGITKHQAYHLTSTKRIPFYRPFGKKIYLRKEDIIGFLLENPVTTGTAIAKQSISKTIKF